MQRNWIGRSEGATVLVRRRRLRRTHSTSSPRASTRVYGVTYLGRRARASASSHGNRDRTAADAVDAIRREPALQIGTRTHELDGKDGRVHRRLRDQPALARARADLGDELRAGRLWNGRGDGRSRARRARLRVRAASTGCRSRRSIAPPGAGGTRRRCKPRTSTTGG